MRRTHNASFNA